MQVYKLINQNMRTYGGCRWIQSKESEDTMEKIIRTKDSVKEKISGPLSYVASFSKYANKRTEHFLVTTLNGAHVPIHTYIVSIGLVNRTMVAPREVFWYAIKDMAVAVIVCHNHPSGNTNPSPEDIDITKRLGKAGEVLGIPLLDHIILGKGGGYYSMVESGDIDLIALAHKAMEE